MGDALMSQQVIAASLLQSRRLSELERNGVEREAHRSLSNRGGVM